MSSEQKFIVDAMLGSLARWLRILGYDTVYGNKMEDWLILRRAELEGRIILTRDRSLHHKALKRGLKSILLQDEDLATMLARIAGLTGIRLYVDYEKTRCPEDNTPLRKTDKSEVRDKVPPRVYSIHEDFWICPRCGKVYWVGNHWRMIETILSDARKKLGMFQKQFEKGMISEPSAPFRVNL
ncbi:MAG: Mut7-C RNAse domain-containing protein [Desulfurococcus sp.]|uniref:Mut7-C RNAse domain-containing protein n=1 Tax=Desulfurococcus sp. TaxID=51678 RepID=UPI003169E251